ncbi:MAG: SIS domain-containing protein [Flavobacteriales bacterium]|nr:SIS domain-containing protein [Flavobacteriales bacterium]
MNLTESYIQLLKDTLDQLDRDQINLAIDAFLKVRNAGGTIYTFGNGGSGASASHAAGDFLKGASYGLEKRFRVICLNDNIPSMMAIANDIGWDEIFIEPLKNFLQPHDLVIGISGSGNSTNVVKAMQYAKEQGVTTIAFCGYKGGKIKELADIVIHSKAMDMEIAEDIHMIVFNIIKKEMINRLHTSNSMGSQYDERVK